MRFDFVGRFPIYSIESASAALVALLQKEGLDHASQLSISFTGWRGDDRCQIVDDNGFVRPLCVDWEAVAVCSEQANLVLPTDVTIRDRPNDLEWNPLAVMAGRDD